MKSDSTKNGFDRRAFLKGLAGFGGAFLALGAGGSATNVLATASPVVRAKKVPGVQLYTVRDLMQKDFEGTVEKVAQLGYKEVEFAGYYDRTPEQVRQLLDRLGLTSPSVHVGVEDLRANLEGTIKTAQVVGHQYLTIPALGEAFSGKMTAESWHKYAEEFNKIGAAVKEKGLHLAYHNHHFEYVPADGDKLGLDVLISETDPSLVNFEMDLMWTVVAGQDPVAWFEKYPGRFHMWHVKDVSAIKDVQAAAQKGMEGFRTIMDHISAVGEGEIDFKRIFAQAEKAGVKHYFVENDAPKDAMANIQASIGALNKLLA